MAIALNPDLAKEPFKLVATRQASAKTKVRLRDLFTEGRAAGTILLWLILYLGFATTTVIILQTPTLLRASGIALGTTGILVGIYSVFAVCGMAIAGRLVEKFGPERRWRRLSRSARFSSSGSALSGLRRSSRR